jgi:hypothetical protein
VSDSSNPLIDFYCRSGTDHRGRRFVDMIGMDDAQLERTHDYIQWLFPTVMVSPFNPDAPSLDATAATRLRADPVAQVRLREALLRLLAFYGLELDDSDPADPEVMPGPAFDARSRTWLIPGNHNYRRLTRVLASLIVLGRRPLADALFRCLESLYRNRHGGEIGDRAISHWRRQLS